MKKIILTAMLVTGYATGVLCQGTITFQNALGGVGGRVNFLPGYPIQGTFSVQLLYGAVGTPIYNLTPGVIFTSTTGSGLFYDTYTQTLPGIPAGLGSSDPVQNVELAIIGWTGSYPSYAAALAAGADVASTFEFTNPTGGGGEPSATAANLINWTDDNSIFFGEVPEPSTIVLGGLGAAALLAFRRRK